MGSLEWTLWFVCLYFKVSQMDCSSWTIKVPTSVDGLLGSCVVIPCTFDYPKPNKPITEYSGMWMNVTKHLIYHPDNLKMIQEYRERTELGDTRQKNCSLKIDPVQESDTGPFLFRIEMKDYDKYSYKKNQVSIATISKPKPISLSVKEEVVAGQTVSASCSVSHSCPASPPNFSWSHPGQVHFHSQKLNNGQWNATSTLTFDPTSADHNKSLQCNVTYKGGLHDKARKVLKVQYAPEVKSDSSCSSNADVIKCVCTVESWPPSNIHFMLSDGVLPNTTVENHGVLTTGTLLAKLGSYNSVICLASNTQGQTDVTLSFPSGEIPSLYIFIAIGAGGTLVMLVMVGVLVKKCRGRSRDTPTALINPTRAERDLDLHYTVAKRKENYDDDAQDIYNNDPIYSNVEFDRNDGDAIYANM